VSKDFAATYSWRLLWLGRRLLWLGPNAVVAMRSRVVEGRCGVVEDDSPGWVTLGRLSLS
jgi:hypothetical protein